MNLDQEIYIPVIQGDDSAYIMETAIPNKAADMVDLVGEVELVAVLLVAPEEGRTLVVSDDIAIAWLQRQVADGAGRDVSVPDFVMNSVPDYIEVLTDMISGADAEDAHNSSLLYPGA